ncbi:hypothetical protein [Frigoribacterium faeni]|uniref:Uncharacterized protein n=1 Tax=Frigoribacterium faeni TaxID=145483 RepID=A0A7W3JH49_9MICO|nr:hypothetical protein [Frigoribacterium faeni]MBA8812689.1 hypothetical protein [Frigoribacterium faeni]GEK82296.1 hypothetical protein FFA01_06050 [Frigoribacterium faeni]
MPRDRANIRTDIWSDDDWRQLSFGAQWLYNYVLTHGTLNAVGVADWRPRRILRVTTTMTEAVLRELVAELTNSFFLVLDEDTEEVLVRSFFRHDGILTNPNMLATIKRDYAAVSSPLLLGVIAHEANRLRTEYPDGITKKFNPWDRSELTTLLKGTQIDIRTQALRVPNEELPSPLFGDDTPSPTPYRTPSPTPSDRGSGTTTSTATSTEKPLSPDESDDGGFLIRPNWAPNQKHRDKATSLHIDVDRQAARFIEHANRNVRRLKNWNAAFTNWLKQEAVYAQQRSASDATRPAPRAQKRTAADVAFENFTRKYGGSPNEPHGNRSALDPGSSHRLANGQ